jgi:NADH dehydrogenase [ubiquinone] 1 alpha subcomplex assembly factor 8
MPTMAGRVRPIEKFAEAVGKCSVEVRRVLRRQEVVDFKQAAAYGKCIVADYQSVHQDMCAREFARLKDCYLVSYLPPCCQYVLLIEVQKAAKKP